MKKETIKWQPKQYYERKMSKNDLDSHINEMKRGARIYKNKKAYTRKEKHKGNKNFY